MASLSYADFCFIREEILCVIPITMFLGIPCLCGVRWALAWPLFHLSCLVSSRPGCWAPSGTLPCLFNNAWKHK